MSHFCPIPVADRAQALPEPELLPDSAAVLAPEHARALRNALLGGETHYTPRPGLPELRERIAALLVEAGAPPGGQVVITAGRQEALFVVRGVDPVVDLGDRFPEADLSGVSPDAVLVGSLDAFPELAPFRLGFFRSPDALLARLRGLKQAISICTAAPSQRAAALVLGAERTARPPEIRTRKDDSRYSLMELAAQIPDVVSLGRGDPDADASRAVIEAAAATLGETEALDPRGQRWLREAIAEREEARIGVRFDPDSEIVVTNGAQEGITVAMLALLGEREDVILADPYYTSYLQAIDLAGGKPALVPAAGGSDFGMRADAATEAFGRAERPRLLAIVNFSNPTGARTRAEEVRGLAELADRGHLWVLSDEVYGDMTLDGEGPILSPATLPGMKGRTLTLGSVSKSYAMTGFRIGYLTGPADAIAACARVKAALSGPSAALLAAGRGARARRRRGVPRTDAPHLRPPAEVAARRSP